MPLVTAVSHYIVCLSIFCDSFIKIACIFRQTSEMGMTERYTKSRACRLIAFQRLGVEESCRIYLPFFFQNCSDIGIIDSLSHKASERCFSFQRKTENTVCHCRIPKRKLHITDTVERNHAVLHCRFAGLVTIVIGTCKRLIMIGRSLIKHSHTAVVRA